MALASIATLLVSVGSAEAQIGPGSMDPMSRSSISAPQLPSPDAQHLAELRAMLARVKLHLGKRLAGDSKGGPAPDGLDIRNASPAGGGTGVEVAPMAVAQLQQDLQAMRSLQTVLVRELAETRDSLKAADQRTANLNREIADLRTQVVSATDEIRLLHDRIPPAAPSDLSLGTSVVTAPTGLSDTPPPAQQRSTIRESGPTVLSEEIVARLDGSVFHSGSAELQPEAASKLAAAAQFMVSHPKVLVRIVGHTDASGNDERNLVLSTRRAETVRDYLADKFGLRVSRLVAEGKGELEPIASNDTAAGRQANRRVEIQVRP